MRNHEDLSAEDEQSRALLAAALPEIELAWQLTEALCSWYATAYATRASAG
ncbi:MAG: hypothetical protein E6I32_20845 [Chloroflexi bacterium]|nr:MAG: hypothetical protein E6I32_20845 [Chloroflexota bacterium]